MQALVTGATGLVGGRLLRDLDEAAVLTRDPDRARSKLADGVTAYAWVPGEGPAPAEAFAGVDVVFHLAGEPVASGRWTAEKKRRIRASRVEGTRNLVAGLGGLEPRPAVLVAASAVGYYGDRGDEELPESSSGGRDYLAEVCAAWEAESLMARELGMRVVVARIGIVLSPEGGALGRMLGPFQKGLGGPLGNGRQWMPWVHVDDVAGLLLHAAWTEAVSGPMNVAAPAPVPNKVFSRTLGSVLGRPAWLRAPRFGLRLAFGELSQVLLASQRAVPGVATETGYRFRYGELRPALEACLGVNEGR